MEAFLSSLFIRILIELLAVFIEAKFAPRITRSHRHEAWNSQEQVSETDKVRSCFLRVQGTIPWRCLS